MKELSYGAINGPYHEKPFPMYISPLMVRDKPKGCSVNHGVSKNTYLDTYFTLHYLSLDHITQAIYDLGPHALLYKIDISRAFRHLRIDPRYYNDYYFDGSHYTIMTTTLMDLLLLGTDTVTFFSKGAQTLSTTL